MEELQRDISVEILTSQQPLCSVVHVLTTWAIQRMTCDETVPKRVISSLPAVQLLTRGVE